MVTRKSPYEIAIMRESGRLVAQAHALVRAAIAPGVATIELDALVHAFASKAGGELVFKGYKGFPGHICASINEEIVHGVPGPRRLAAGDIIAVDIGIRYKGYVGDAAWTYPVGEVDAASRALLDAGEEALRRGIAAAQPGARVSAIGRAVQSFAESKGYGVVRDYTGHGVGESMHEAPQIPNFVEEPRVGSQDPKLKPGLVIAIEPMLNAGTHLTATYKIKGWEVVITRDRKRSVHFEHTVAITEAGPVILTLP